MMEYYVEILIKPDAEMRENFLLNLVYTKLHKALFDMNSRTIGISFPDYQLKLGKRIRLHGQLSILENLQSINWLGALIGYCSITPPSKIPENVRHRTVSRKQNTMTQAKLNRLLKRGTIDSENIREYRAKMFSKGLQNPYLEMESASNGNKHRRYLQFGELSSDSVLGEFDSFGLSKIATVPWF